jgi:hypothetical protein
VPALVLDKPGDLATAIAEALQPGAEVVAALRSGHPQLERPFARELEREFNVLGKMSVAAADAKGGVVMESKADVQKRINQIVAAMRIDIWMEKTIKPMFEQFHKREAELTVQILNRFDLDVSLRDKLEEKILKRGGTRAGLLDISGDTKTAIFRAIEEGRELGLNPRDTAKLFEDHVPAGRFTNAGSSYRAKLIARTEVLEGQRRSSIDLYRTSPVVKNVVAFDGDNDEECAARNGQVFTFDEAEIEADEEHPNGTLAFGPVT